MPDAGQQAWRARPRATNAAAHSELSKRRVINAFPSHVEIRRADAASNAGIDLERAALERMRSPAVEADCVAPGKC